MLDNTTMRGIWQTGRFRVDLSLPKIMGIVNVTPDSFFDGGAHASVAAACQHCDKLVSEGADILDIGGESSRPGAVPLALDEELRRVVPVLQHAVRLGVPVSVDTYKPDVMQVALDLGVDIVNDIQALSDPRAVSLIAQHESCGVCLMHMQGTPHTMQSGAIYEDVLVEVIEFLKDRVQAVEKAGVARGRIAIDPGIGFGKSVEHNFALLRHQSQLLSLGLPVLVGWSRKSSLGAVTGRAVDHRLPASIAASLAAIAQGASIVRVHDVAETVDAIKVWRQAGLI